MRLSFTFLFFLVAITLFGQSPIIFGDVTDARSGRTIELATIYVKGINKAVDSDAQGSYRLEVQANKKITLVCKVVNYVEAEYVVEAMKNGVKRNINFRLTPQKFGEDIVITASAIDDEGMVREEVTELKKLPTTTGNFESVLPHIALGASGGTGGELSSQYNVRGGNYDENLVYVNDFEIFRPQLIRSGQQEGLTFPNIDLIRDLSFSSGGFQSKYGDKMSSVLDIRYKRPDEFRASLGGSFLGASGHVEGSKRIGGNSYNKLRYLMGARYKTTKHILGSLDVKGEYAPQFVDVQAYVTYDFTKDFQMGIIGNYNRSRYDFVPKSQSTVTGLFNQAIRFSSVFQGQEVDRFINGMLGVSFTLLPDREKNPYFLKLLASRYLSEEAETFDILGFYRLSEIETNFGSEDAGQEVAFLGDGTQHSFARNFLFSEITNVAHKGGIEFENKEGNKTSSHFVQWGAKWQHEYNDDILNEWERLDSAGYSLPFSAEQVLISSVLKTNNQLRSNRFSAFVQNSFGLTNEATELKITGGVRATYWDFNDEFNISPRMQVLYKPRQAKRDISYKFSSGIYYQPPFYRELRRPDGSINTNLKAQKSIHVVGGITYDFPQKGVQRPFRLIGEVYYKKLDNLVSYEVDNVRIRYSGENDAEGYIVGLDLRLNGEFVPGAESWINLSILSAKETLINVQHLGFGEEERSYVPRPTDRFFNLNMFFQDYLPKNENFKVNLNLSLGSGLPFGVKDNNIVRRNVFRYKAYHRVDIGFSLQLWKEEMQAQKPNHPLRFTKNAWISLEVFNLLDVANQASNTWVKTIFNNQYAIPNTLTSRRLNLKFKVDF